MRKFASDQKLLPIISVDKIHFVDVSRIRYNARSSKFSDEENKMIKNEINKLVSKDMIKETWNKEQEFVPPIFISYKSNGKIRLILN